MKIVDVSEAATDLPALLTQVENGEEVVIAREGKPIARLSRAAPFRREPGVFGQQSCLEGFPLRPRDLRAARDR